MRGMSEMGFLGGYYGEDGPVEIVHEPIWCDQCGLYHDGDCADSDYYEGDE